MNPLIQPEITETDRLFQLATMVLTDKVPGGIVPPAYLYTQTGDNQDSVFSRVATLIPSFANYLLVLDDMNGTNKGYPGATAWIAELERRGSCPFYKMRKVPCKQPLNTYSESVALVEYAEKMGIERLIIVAPPFHALRAFISAVSALRRNIGAAGIRVYNQVGITLPWKEEVRHSQGTLIATRQGLILTELARIREYQEKGDLVSAGDALEYLKWRDSDSK